MSRRVLQAQEKELERLNAARRWAQTEFRALEDMAARAMLAEDDCGAWYEALNELAKRCRGAVAALERPRDRTERIR